MILVVAAMDEEYKAIEVLINDPVSSECFNVKYHKGTIHNKEVLLILSGVGKVNASYALTTIINNFNIDFVINVGSAGGISNKNDLNVLDIIVADKVCQHDVDLTLANRLRGELPDLPQYYKSSISKEMINEIKKTGLNFVCATIASGDQFVGNINTIDQIKKEFVNVCAVEMEAGAIAQICFKRNIHFIVLRSISDVVGKEKSNQVQFDEYIKYASENSAKVTHKIIEII